MRLPELNDRGSVQYVRPPVELGVGEYDVRIELRNERAYCGDFQPLPLGWQLYSQPVQATTRIRVHGATSQPANRGQPPAFSR